MSRVDVYLVGTPSIPLNTTVFAASVSRQGRSPQPSPSVGSAFMPASVSRSSSVGIPTFGRDTLVLGVDQPGPTNTGVLPNVARQTVNGNVTLSTSQLYENKTITGRLSITGANITVRNCWIQGNTTAASGVVNCGNSAVANFVMEDCTVTALNPNATWGGVYGHDMTIRRCDISGTTDLVNVVNTSYGAAGWSTGVVIEQSWLHGYVWWTGAAAGDVHPTDTETHNDVIQMLGGVGTIIRGNTLDAAFAKQSGHWQVTNPSVEPYTTVALHSLADGGPYQTIPDRGTGNEASGRYNWDDNCVLMMNSSEGYVADLTFDDNWIYGGNYAVNGGGNPYPGGGISLGNFRRNRFDRSQGSQGSGGDNTYTLAFLGSWAGHVNAPVTGVDKNYYMDNGNAITVRT